MTKKTSSNAMPVAIKLFNTNLILMREVSLKIGFIKNVLLTSFTEEKFHCEKFLASIKQKK